MSMLAHWLVLCGAVAAVPPSSPLVFPGLGVALPTPGGGWFNTTYGVGDFESGGPRGPWTLDNANVSAVVTARDGGFFDLAFTPKRASVPRVSFPMLEGSPLDDRADLAALLPFLGGIFVQSGAGCYADGMNDDVMQYPGGFHAPYVMLATPDAAFLAAATTWPPHHVHPKRRLAKGAAPGPEPLQIDWVNGYDAGATHNLSILLTTFGADTAAGAEPWQAAVLAYRAWQAPHRLPPPPPAPLESEGFMAVGLENEMAFNLSVLDSTFGEWKDVLGRVLFWGQMSNYAGPPKYAKPPLRPGEQVGCCLLDQEMHPRYLETCGNGDGAWQPGSQCLPAWARKVASEGYEVGFYTRKGSGDLLANVTWLEDWLTKMAAEGGNAQYVDTFARVYNGKPSEVLELIERGTPPRDVVVEGWSDAYPFAGLLSGYHHGYDWCNASANTTVYDMNPWGSRGTGSYIKLVRLLMGDTVGYFGYEDSELEFWGPKNNHFSERQAFLLGAKLDAGPPLTGFLRQIKEVRDSVRWWSRGLRYLDTVGVDNPHVGLVDVRRHDDSAGRTVLVVDNWRNVTGLTVGFGGQQHAVSGSTLSAIEV